MEIPRNLLKPNKNLIEASTASYGFLTKDILPMTRYNCLSYIENKEMRPTLQLVGVIAAQFPSNKVKDEVLAVLKKEGKMNVLFDQNRFKPHKTANNCWKHLNKDDMLFDRREIDDMKDVCGIYSSYWNNL